MITLQSLVEITKTAGYVYLAKITRRQWIYYKIGSTTNLDRRMRALCPFCNGSCELLMFGYTANIRKTEKHIHILINKYSRSTGLIGGLDFCWSAEYYPIEQVKIEPIKKLIKSVCVSVKEFTHETKAGI